MLLIVLVRTQAHMRELAYALQSRGHTAVFADTALDAVMKQSALQAPCIIFETQFQKDLYSLLWQWKTERCCLVPWERERGDCDATAADCTLRPAAYHLTGEPDGGQVAAMLGSIATAIAQWE